ncbi:hypothetical protein [Fibrella aquatilis]|uniref:Uncharacterized protein n=1 Tax=Fibrella aquatilis TaxID=2817059 RepID=A0A939K363_9BACT|nr:hypothetical protein [Fibrella aquatilis]MBO0934030.1 hypothetical protein [Fibrella aquatilis]
MISPLRLLCLAGLFLLQSCNYTYVGQEAEKVRLKTLFYKNSGVFIGITSTFDYSVGKQIQQCTFANNPEYLSGADPTGKPVALYTYEANGQLASYDFRYARPTSKGRTGELTVFTNTPALITSESYFLEKGGQRVLFKKGSYTLANGLVTSYSRQLTDKYDFSQLYLSEQGYPTETSEYTYAGGNLVRVKTKNNEYELTTDYLYDANPNPLQGIYNPDITPVRRYSRNNMLTSSSTYIYSNGQNIQGAPLPASIASPFVYDGRGYPVSESSGFNRFEYEAY